MEMVPEPQDGVISVAVGGVWGVVAGGEGCRRGGRVLRDAFTAVPRLIQWTRA